MMMNYNNKKKTSTRIGSSLPQPLNTPKLKPKAELFKLHRDGETLTHCAGCDFGPFRVLCHFFFSFFLWEILEFLLVFNVTFLLFQSTSENYKPSIDHKGPSEVRSRERKRSPLLIRCPARRPQGKVRLFGIHLSSSVIIGLRGSRDMSNALASTFYFKNKVAQEPEGDPDLFSVERESRPAHLTVFSTCPTVT